jgi:IS30 family transposase
LAITVAHSLPSATVIAALKAVLTMRGQPTRLPLDYGTEFHSYEKLEAVVDTKCYFATPHHSWERGSNENVNGLFRQYVPKRTSMEHLTQRGRQRIADKLNRRPRKRLGFKTPEEVYAA